MVINKRGFCVTSSTISQASNTKKLRVVYPLNKNREIGRSLCDQEWTVGDKEAFSKTCSIG